MWIVKLALRRPYTFVVAAIVIFILTPFVLLRMPTDILPSINIPVVSVVWTYNGLNAHEIEQRIVYNHERMISTLVKDIQHIESTAYSGGGVIKIYLQPGASVAEAIGEITASAQTILRTMPPGTTPPFVVQYNASSVPILQYSLASQQLIDQQLQDIAMNQVKIGLSTVRGSSIPFPAGGKSPVIAVDIDLPALEAKNLSPQDVITAVNAQNLVLPSGTAKIGKTEYEVSLNSSPTILDELNNLPIKTVNGAVIRIHDVAQVYFGAMPQKNIVKLNGIPGVLLTVFKTGAASTLQVVDGIKKAMARMMPTLPSSVHVKEFADQSIFVRAAINGVLSEGIIAAALTALMILLFLGTWRGTFIVATSIPLSILVAIILLGALGETINLMTLGGLALAVGILVDDATVELENVHRHMGRGEPTIQAIFNGAQEIALPAFVSTLSISIVFVPMFFLTGVAKYLFVPLAEAVVFAMLTSYVLSRTLVPTMVKWFYKHFEYTGELAQPEKSSRLLRPFVVLQIGFEKWFKKFRDGYHRLLGIALSRRGMFAALFLLFVLGTWFLIPFLGQDFFPSVDAGQFRLHVRAPTGMRIEETANFVDGVEKVIRNVVPKNELGGMLDNIGVPSGGVPLTYIDNGLVGIGDADIWVSLNSNHKPTEDYIRELRLKLNQNFPGATFYFLPSDITNQTINFGVPAPIDVQIVGKNHVKNRVIADKLFNEIRRIPGAVDVRIQQPNDQPNLEFAVDRTKASMVGLTQRDVASSVLLTLSGSAQTQPNYWVNPKNGVQYQVNVRVPEYNMNYIGALTSMPITGSKAGQNNAQLLYNLASLKQTGISPVYSHYDVQPVLDVYAGADGRSLGDVLRDVTPLIKKVKKELPKGSFIVIRGQAETMSSSYTGLLVGLAMAIVLVYLLLVVNFQSWLDPFIIIMALPGALAGVIWGLYLSFTNLSVPALLGAIMSVGVGTANSILLVTFARDNMKKGIEPLNAVWDAAASRLRPVLMTALAMIIGMLPMALGIGEGSEQNAPLGIAVIGGLAVATFATLFFVPVIFSLLHKKNPTDLSLDEINLLNDKID
ncbi:MAG: efflux RND transporter permease subunit [Ignavibacteriaceae bacterium]